MQRTRVAQVSALALLAALPPSLPAGADESVILYTVRDLGSGDPVALNDSGQVLLRRYYPLAAEDPDGFRHDVWASRLGAPGDSPLAPYTWQDLTSGIAPGSGSVYANDLANDGRVVGSMQVGFLTREFPLWYQDVYHAFSGVPGALADLGTATLATTGSPCEVPGEEDHYFPQSAASSIARDGGGVVGSTGRQLPRLSSGDGCDLPAYAASLVRSHVFLGTATNVLFEGAPSDLAAARCISSGGTVVGTLNDRAYRFGGGTLSDVSPSAANTVTDGGRIFGHVDLVAGEFAAGGFAPFAGAGTADSQVRAALDDGTAVGVLGGSATVWSGGTRTDLNDVVETGLTRQEPPYDFFFVRLEDAVDVNTRGQILCRGYENSASGGMRAFLLTPVCRGIEADVRVLDFGDVEKGTVATAEISVLNCSAQRGRIEAPTLRGRFRRKGAAAATVSPGERATFSFQFSPSAVGPASADAEFTGPGGSRFLVKLRGTGVPVKPKLLIIPGPALDFGTGIFGSRTYPVFVQNLADVPAVVTIGTVAAPFSTTAPSRARLAARGTLRFDVTYRPRIDGQSATASLSFTSNVRGAPPQSLPLSGGAVARTARVRSVTGGGAEFRVLPGDWVELTADSVLPEGAEVGTDPDSTVELELPDGSRTTIRPATQIKLSAYFKPGGVVASEILLAFGRLVSKVIRWDSIKSDFKVRAPTAIAGVRGTEFELDHDAGSGTTTLRVTEGQVELDPENPSLRTVLVKAGKQVTVTATSLGKVVPLE